MGSNFKFDCDAYLDRIGVHAPLPVSEGSLEMLHRAHTYTIPFENFDILLGRGIDLSLEWLFQKINLRPRGGYCFELNGLYLQLLQSLGFQARPLLARGHTRGEPSGRHHQLSLVTVNGREWIADVGFGANGLRAPIPFELGRIARQDGLEFRLIDCPPYGNMLQILEAGQWQDLYSFDLEYVCSADIESGNHFTSTSPKSHFTWTRMAALPKADGRISLKDLNLRVVVNGHVSNSELEQGAGYLESLYIHFGIDLEAPYEALQPIDHAGIAD
jgi:N-hydroxyarylamine O-acetyltransferase